MSALQTPAMDAPGAEWGRLAVSLPGWRWMPGMVASIGQATSRVDDIAHPWPDDVPSWPDPDDPATAGGLLALLGPGWCWQQTDDGCIVSRHLISGFTLGVWDRNAHRAPTLGRAAIAAAAALGRWPGGDS